MSNCILKIILQTFKIVALFLFVYFLDSHSYAHASEAELEPINQADVFWKKSELYSRITQERWIAVSSKHQQEAQVSKEALLAQQSGWLFLGGGQVKATMDKSWKMMREFHRLAQIKDFFKKVDYDKEQKKLSLTIKILAIEKNLVLKFQETEMPDKKELYFEVENGFMKSLHGVVSVEKVLVQDKSDMGLRAFYNQEVGWPNWLFALTTEMIMHSVAADLRLIIEKGD